MIRHPGRLGPQHPVDTGREQTLREVGRRVAVLARPHPGWAIMLGRQGSDGHLTDIDVRYHQGSEHRLLVRTTRPAPAGARIWSLVSLEGFLRTYVANHDDDPADPADPAVADGTGPATLHLDGASVPAVRITRGGFFALSATDGDETFSVAGTIDLEGLARELSFDTTGTRPRTGR